MRIDLNCPACGRPVRSHVSPVERTIACDCGWRRAVRSDELEGSAPRVCLACGNEDLWRQKDFPQAAGLAVIAVQIAVSTTFWYLHRPIWTYITLAAFAVLDMLLFALLPDVLVCYRCRTRHRMAAGEPSRHGSFDHERAERYRQERLRAADK
ncbi:MAG: hypothetical protein KF774_09230 [Planctomyces sp.]|nr:hypothetical protein [Planctomyces sp.]